jgi:hypothetical protein
MNTVAELMKPTPHDRTTVAPSATAEAITADIGLTPDQLATWHERGWLVLRDCIPLPAITALREVFAGVVARQLDQLQREGVITDTRPELPFERRYAEAAGIHAGRFGRGWRSEIISPALFDLHRSPRLLAAMSAIFAGDGVYGHPVWNARPKLPGQQLTVVPWHQDSAYFGPDSEHQTIVTAWVPLVPTPAHNGGMQVADGSHRDGLAAHRVEDRTGKFLEIADGNPPAASIVDVAVGPGDALVFGNLLKHRSVANLSDGIRWSVDLRFHPEHIAGNVGGCDLKAPWVLRSANRPATTYEQWRPLVANLPW